MNVTFNIKDLDYAIQIRNQILEFKEVDKFQEGLISIVEGINVSISKYQPKTKAENITFEKIGDFLSSLRNNNFWLDYLNQNPKKIDEKDFILSKSTVHRQLTELDENNKIKIHNKSTNHLANIVVYLILEKKFNIYISKNGFLEKIIDNNGIVLISNQESKEYIAYYYRVGGKIGVATLSIFSHPNSENHYGKMDYHYSRFDRKLYCSDIYDDGKYLYITNRNSSEDLNQVIQTHIIISRPEKDKEDKGYLTAAYSTVHREGGEVMAGIMVLERINKENKKQIKSLIDSYQREINFDIGENISENITYFLKNQTLKVHKLHNNDILPFKDEVDRFSKYVDEFQGYGLNNSLRTLMLYRFEIKKCGKVECEYEIFESKTIKKIEGNIKYCNENIMLIYFDFLDKFNIHRFYYFLNITRDSEKDGIMKGVASGFDKELESPFSGKLFLRRKKNPIIKSYSKLETAKFFNSSEKDLTSYFLSENEDKFSTDALFLKDFGKISPNPFISPQIELSGDFEVFVSGYTKLGRSIKNEQHSEIFRYSLSIKQDFTVVLSQNNKINCDGLIEFWDNYLIIRLYDAKRNKVGREVSNGFDGIMLFSLKPEIPKTKRKNFFGSMIKIDDNQIQNLTCLMTQTFQNVPWVNSYFKGMDSIIGNIEGEEILYSFDDFDGEFNNGLLSFLQGTLDRKFRIPKNTDRVLLPRKKEYRRFYFYCSCNIAYRIYCCRDQIFNSNSKGADIAKNSLKLSPYLDELKTTINELYNIGFASDKFAGIKIEELLEEGQLKKIKQENENASFDEIKESIESLLEDRELLLEEVKNAKTFGQDEILKLIKNKWSYLF